MAGAPLELQRALVAALTGDTGAGGLRHAAAPLVTGVFDGAAPQGTPVPYIVVGDHAWGRFDAFQNWGLEDDVTLHVWTTYAGLEQAFLIRDRIRAVLEDDSLAVAGWALVSCLEVRGASSLGPDGVTRDLALTYRAQIAEAA